MAVGYAAIVLKELLPSSSGSDQDSVSKSNLHGNIEQSETVTTSACSSAHRTGVFNKRKGYLVPVHAMKAYMGNEGRVPLIPNLSIRWGKNPIPTGDWVGHRAGLVLEKRNICCPCLESNPRSSSP